MFIVSGGYRLFRQYPDFSSSATMKSSNYLMKWNREIIDIYTYTYTYKWEHGYCALFKFVPNCATCSCTSSRWPCQKVCSCSHSKGFEKTSLEHWDCVWSVDVHRLTADIIVYVWHHFFHVCVWALLWSEVFREHKLVINEHHKGVRSWHTGNQQSTARHCKRIQDVSPI